MADIFLKKYMSEFIQKIRNPMGLADDLYAKNFIQKEMYQNIKTQETNLRKTREIYESLNSTKHYDFMCDWLKENESDVFEELELLHRKRDTEAEAPQKKKARLENEDETDFTIFPDLKRISTFAKLERWVSEPEISQKLISDLERQLGDNGMADLKKKLKDKEPKNILCFNANNIDNIRKNKELDKFLSKTNNTEIPKLTFSMFFKKGGSVSSGNNAQSSDMQETRIHEMKEQPQRFNVPNVPRHIDVSLSQYDPFTKKEPLEDDLGSTDMKEPWTDKIDEQLKRSNVPMHEDESLHQKEQITKKETPLEDRLGSTDMQDTNIDEIDEESQRSNVPMHIACLHQDESIIKNKMPLEDRCGNMNMQHNEQANMQVNPEPFSSKQLQDNSPGSASKYSYSTSLEYLPQNNKRLPEEEVLAVFSDTGDKDIMIHENKDNESESKTTEQPCGGSFLQMHHEVKADAPSQEPTDMQGTHIDEKEEQSQRSNVPMYEDLSLYQNDPFTKKETPLENRCGSTDMQETRIHEMKEQPQRFNVPNVPRHIDVSLSQYNPLIKKEPLEDGLGSTDMKEPWTDKIDEQLKRSNVPMHEEESRYQKDQITKKETPLEDGLGSTDMQNTHNDKIDEEHQKSNVPMHAACLHQDESIIKNKMPLEDRCGNMNMQHNEQANMQVNPEPFSSKQLQDNSPGSASKYTQSNSTEFLAQYKNTAILAPNRDVKDQTEATKKREKSKCQKEKKKKSKDDLLLDWAMRQCNDRKEELKNILDQISIINMAEHSDYPCFTAENVMVYKYLTPESQIIFIADDSSSISTMTMVHYHMFVCNIKKAILLGPKKQDEQEIQYIESKVPVDTCTGFIFKAFAPALTVYKKIQKEEKLYSLI